jgi:DNA-binding NtrC family response regulator
MTLDTLEKDYILRCLDAHQRDIGRAADILGIHRKTLLRKLRRYGMDGGHAGAGAPEGRSLF